MLFANVDDPNYTIESILNYVDYGQEFRDVTSWAGFKNRLTEFCSKGSGKSNSSSILIQSWQRFRRLINNSINDDLFVNARSMAREEHQVYLSDEVLNINGGEMMVVDIAGLNEQLQCLVFGDIIRSVYSLKHGDYDQDQRSSKKSVPKRVIIFVDELNKYAPSTSSKNSPLLANLLDITERGRSEGVVLFSAEQFRSAIHERIKGNCGTNVYGRTNAIEVSRPDYKFVPTVYANMMTRLKKGDLILHHPVFKTLLKIQFPFPSYNQGGSK
jgi:DNA helicase HerA-like ATPase